MKKILLLGVLMLLTITFVGCKTEQASGKCYINGTINSSFNGKKIFLVPMVGIQDAAHVDSVVIQDGKFKFVKDTAELAVIRVDYHYRTGIEELLVVTEPGTVDVVIDSISDCKGTPQNDSLSKWKNVTERHNMECGIRMRKAKQAEQQGDSIMVKQIKAEVDAIHKSYKKYTRQLGANMKQGPLFEFLTKLYPTSYKKRMPDGTIVTVKEE